MIKKCLNPNKAERITFEDLLKIKLPTLNNIFYPLGFKNLDKDYILLFQKLESALKNETTL